MKVLRSSIAHSNKNTKILVFMCIILTFVSFHPTKKGISVIDQDPISNVKGMNSSVPRYVILANISKSFFRHETLQFIQMENFTPKYQWKIVGDYTDSWTIDKIDYQPPILRKTYGLCVRYSGSFTYNDVEIFVNPKCQSITWDRNANRINSIVPKIICVGVSARFTYAHVLTDILPSILLCPEHVRKKAYIVDCSGVNRRMSRDLYGLVDITPDRILYIDADECVFGHEIWYVAPQYCESRAINMLANLRKHILQRIPQKFTPTRHVIIKRPPGVSRYVNNLEELQKAATDKYGVDWEVILSPDNILNTVRIYQSIKVAFMVGGSAFANMYFMHENSVVAELHSEIAYVPSSVLALACNIKYCLARMPRLVHFRNGPQSIDIELAANLIDVAYKWSIEHD